MASAGPVKILTAASSPSTGSARDLMARLEDRLGRGGEGLIELKPVHTFRAYWLSRGFRPLRTVMTKTIGALLI